MTDLGAFPAAGGSCSLSLHFLSAFPGKLKCIVRYELTQQLQKVIIVAMTLKAHGLFLSPLHVSVKLNWPACPELQRNREDS